VDRGRKALRAKKLVKSWEVRYGKGVRQYNSRIANRMRKNNYVAVEDLGDVSHMLGALQVYYSDRFGDIVDESVVKGNGAYDERFEGKISLRDTIRFAIMGDYDSRVEKGDIGLGSCGDLRTFNARVRSSDLYEEYERVFDLDRVREQERSEVMLENKAQRKFRKGYAKNDSVTRTLFYGIGGGLDGL